MKENGNLDILDALENLNTLVDADSLEEIEVTDESLLIPHKGVKKGEREYYWEKAGPDDLTLNAIQETYRSVNIYLQGFYSKMKKTGDTKRLVEGINTVMVLVGEATKNLEKFGVLFQNRVQEFEDYKQLQNFYRNRVIKESFQEFAKAQIPKEKTKSIDDILPEQRAAEEEVLELLGEETEEVAGVHILNDLEVVKRDHLYELFYLKNEAGNNFYTYELARKIKLACDFGEFTEEYFGEDPLLQIKNWEDKSLHLRAQSILKNTKRHIDLFYREAMKYKEMDVVSSLHNALMALMMAAQPRNLIRQFSLKGCHLYFQDFLLFLREALLTREYQKFLIYSPPAGKTFFIDLMELVNRLSFHLFTGEAHDEELKNALKQMVERKKHAQTKTLSETLGQANAALTDAFKKHPNGPIFKAVDTVRETEWVIFDPLHQGNLPRKEWSLAGNHHEIACLHLPSPTLQEIIDKAFITEEFKTFLRSLDPKEHLVFFNFQDRTSWKEHARSLAIEELSRHAEFATVFTVVTLAKDTDFYNQSGLYHDVDEAEVFIDHFNQHLSDEITGYYFAPQLKKELFPSFVQELLLQIHTTFFDEKEMLSLSERLNFIELTYHFLELKIIESVNPTYLAFSSKDALDIGGITNLGFIALLTVDKGKKWSESERDTLIKLLFGPTMMLRERVVHPERFERLHSMIHLLEEKESYLKDFKGLFHKETLKCETKL